MVRKIAQNSHLPDNGLNIVATCAIKHGKGWPLPLYSVQFQIPTDNHLEKLSDDTFTRCHHVILTVFLFFRLHWLFLLCSIRTVSMCFITPWGIVVHERKCSICPPGLYFYDNLVKCLCSHSDSQTFQALHAITRLEDVQKQSFFFPTFPQLFDRLS